jgi:hypothetical protein
MGEFESDLKEVKFTFGQLIVMHELFKVNQLFTVVYLSWNYRIRGF